jgi:type I restriction enzyme M protein
MAKKQKSKPKKTKSFEETLWDAAIKLRSSVEAAEYKHIVLSLIFLKFISDRFETQKAKLIKSGNEKYIDCVQSYAKDCVTYLPITSRWSFITKNAGQDDIAIKIDDALKDIEKNNKELKGALPDKYFVRLGLETSKLKSLIDVINNIDTLTNSHEDVVGRVYEYFLLKFAIVEGKGKGEFYTPKSIVNLIAELIEPYQGKIYDPCCGTGGMFVQSVKFIEKHQGNSKDISIYGQEYTQTTYKLAKMNLAIRGLFANLGEKAKNTFSTDQHPQLKADFIMANPPFNQKDWREEDELVDDYRWNGYEIPSEKNANYGWILHMVSKLSANGVAGFLLSNGALSKTGNEYKIRKKLIENDLIEAIITLPRDMFYSTDISVTLWIINNNKTERNVLVADQEKNYRYRVGEVLFIDLRRRGSEFEKQYIELTADDIQEVVTIYHNWQQKDWKKLYKNIPEFCQSANIKDIKKQDYSLIPSKYIPFIDKDSGIDYDMEMNRLQSKFSDLLSQEQESQQQLIEAFKGLGYEIKL